MFDMIANQSALIFALTIIPFVVICLVLVFIIVRSGSRARASMNWPSTEARILTSQVELRRSSGRNGSSYYPVILYEYNVSGQALRNSQISFGMQMGYGWAGAAQNIVNKYPAGSSVPVYYNPEQPTQAVLERTSGASTKVLSCAVIFIVFILAFTALMTFGGMALMQQIMSSFNGFMPGR